MDLALFPSTLEVCVPHSPVFLSPELGRDRMVEAVRAGLRRKDASFVVAWATQMHHSVLSKTLSQRFRPRFSCGGLKTIVRVRRLGVLRR